MAAPDAPLTLVSALARLRRDPGRGFRFLTSKGEERFYSWDALENEAHRRAAHLATLGLAKGERLAVVVAEGDEFVLSFLGACVAGLVPVPIYPRATFKGIEGYADTVAHIARASGARVLLTMEATRPYVEPALAKDCGLERVVLTEQVFAGEAPVFTPPAIAPDDLCFLQFTSGSTSQPKGVVVTHANLVANATAFLGPHGLDRRDEDLGVSWLPLFHDMGLIGFVLGTIIHDIPVVLLPTSTFARGPRIWLETIHKHRGTITYAPNFAYALAVKRLKDRDLKDLDLSCLRIAGCGAEPIHAQTMRDFADRLAPAGFDARALLPSYGMAEATLAITFHPRGTPLVTDTVDPEAMKRGEALPVPPGTPGALELVACGVPFPEHGLRIVDTETGEPLGERRVGQIVTTGPSVTGGYFGNADATALGWKDGWLQTGDLGYVADGALYICGRLKDLIIIHGANYYPQDLEWAVQDLEGVRRGNVVAFSVVRDGTEQLVVAAEANSADVERLKKAIPERIYEAAGLATAYVAIVGVGALPKTSSGKAQRLKTKRLYEDGLLAEHGSGRAGEGGEPD
jgi:fatty-acyl-CoA synthase